MKRNVAKLGGKAPTIKDIAEKLNISSVSVHRALAGKEGVSEKLRAQILQTAKEMGYEVNYAAASLKRKVCCSITTRCWKILCIHLGWNMAL